MVSQIIELLIIAEITGTRHREVSLAIVPAKLSFETYTINNVQKF